MTEVLEHRDAMMQAAGARGLLGGKERQVGGRFFDAPIEAAKQVTGFSENNEFLTFAMTKVVLEDDFGEHLLVRGAGCQGTPCLRVDLGRLLRRLKPERFNTCLWSGVLAVRWRLSGVPHQRRDYR